MPFPQSPRHRAEGRLSRLKTWVLAGAGTAMAVGVVGLGAAGLSEDQAVTEPATQGTSTNQGTSSDQQQDVPSSEEFFSDDDDDGLSSVAPAQPNAAPMAQSGAS